MDLYLFPLGLVLFPGTPLPLHVFEDRYREMIGRCISDDRPFGVVRITSGTEVGGPAETESVGTMASIREHRRLEDGRYVLIAEGTRRFRIVERLVEVPFPVASVELFDNEAPPTGWEPDVAALEQLLRRYKMLSSEAGEDDAAPVAELGTDPETASYAAAAALVTDDAHKQRLLEMGLQERFSDVETFLASELRRLREAILAR